MFCNKIGIYRVNSINIKGELMKLRGIDFGPVFGASGVQGFFGEEYAFHKVTDPFGKLFNGVTFVAKTTTLDKKIGNMPLKKDGITPKELFPKCIYVDFRKGVVLNAVSISGPGAKALFEDGRWQERTEPFFLSFMSVKETIEERLEELRGFLILLRRHLPLFLARIGLQINYLCPNIGQKIKWDELVDESRTGLEMAAELCIPLMPKLNFLTPIEVAHAIAENKHCDALCVSNTIHWGKLPDKIDWERLFGSKISPLVDFGGGGYSGAGLSPFVHDYIQEMRYAGIKKPINAGGGILCPNDVDTLRKADSIFLGTIRIVRWWRMRKTIERAYELF